MLFGFCVSRGFADTPDAWKVDVAPYLWAIQMNGTVQTGPARLSVSQSFIDIMKHFQGGGMIWLNAHKGKFGVFLNGLYSVLEDRQQLRMIPLSAHNNFGIFSAGASYEIFQKTSLTDARHLAVELFAGARSTCNDTTLKIDNVAFPSNQSWTDPIAGLRTTYDFNPKWQAIFAADGGGVNQHYSYDLQGYIGYTPQKHILFDHTVFYLGYRFLHQKFSNGSGLKLFVWDMNISGPLIGLKAVF